MCKLLTSNIKLPIETDRWQNVEINERISTLCNGQNGNGSLLFAIALSVFHRFTGSDYPFDIFKLHLIYAQRLFKTLLLQNENIPFIVCIDEFAKKKDKVTMIYKPLHRKVNIEEHEPH
jgi:hypothetical protein